MAKPEQAYFFPYKGMRTDLHPLEIPLDSYKRAINVRLNKDGLPQTRFGSKSLIIGPLVEEDDPTPHDTLFDINSRDFPSRLITDKQKTPDLLFFGEPLTFFDEPLTFFDE